MKAIKKIVFIIAMWAIYFLCTKSIAPVVTNEMALHQFEDAVYSFVEFEIYKNVMSYTWVVLLVITIGTFSKEISKLFKKIKEDIN